MKFITYIEDARDDLIVSLKYIKDISSSRQTVVIDKTIGVIKELDRLLEVVNRKPYSPSPKDPALKRIWEELGKTTYEEYKLMVMRLEPQAIKSTKGRCKISGYLENFHLSTTIPDIIEEIGIKYGGGKFQIKIVDGAGNYVTSKTFEIAGLPKIPELEKKPTEKKQAKIEEKPFF